MVHNTLPKMVTNCDSAIKVQLTNALLPYLNDFFATQNRVVITIRFSIKKAKFPNVLLEGSIFSLTMIMAVIIKLAAKKIDIPRKRANLFLFIVKFMGSST